MNNNKNSRIEDILGSLDGTQRAAAPDFFYTRLKARMEKGMEPVAKRPWILRPAFAFTVLAGVLLVNAAVIFQNNDTPETGTSDAETLQSIAAEYSLNDNNTILFDINQDK
ncbi:MAG TPA: hypothetical protein VGO58_17890 [Chitinophagaceae bacterium]|jgi:hypothetical protein|nr:hypothetical protein [Chitinophagaceae bacterium]